ncbi:MAG: ABC transporter permease, partial [Segetibacter sp.]
MIKNYLKIAWRNLMKNKTFSIINIFGLSAGLACCMLITLYLFNELSYDSHQKNSDNLYQLATVFIKGEKEDKMANTPAPMGSAMKQEFPEVIEQARLLGLFAEDKTLLRYTANKEQKSFYETKGYLADTSFFTMFTYNFIEGNAATALNNPLSVVLSEEISQKLFGKQPALNKVIHISSNTNGEFDYTVTGVFKPVNTPSHIDARFFVSMTGGNMETYIKERGTNMANNNMFYTYLLLKPGSDAKRLQAKFPAFIEKYAGKDLKANGFFRKQYITNVKDIHLYADTTHNVTPVASMMYLYILASIALFTLLIACINFMNLSTSRSSKRSSEVGIRKVLGAEKKSLIAQFLGESLLMSVIAFAFAYLLTLLLLPVFNTVSGKDLSLSLTHDAAITAGFFILSIITGFLAGTYPAFYLSSFKPIKVLKGRFSNSLAAVSLRKGLVVFQFVISIILIVASVVIQNQMHYMRSTNLGFAREQQLVLPLRSATAKKLYTALKNNISKNEQVLSAGASFYYPGIFNASDQIMYKQGKTVTDGPDVKTNVIDESFLQTLDIKPVAGRLFSKEFAADTNYRIILNEAAIIKLGFTSPQAAIGKNIYRDEDGIPRALQVVGVVKNFHFQDLHVPIDPFGFFLNSQPFYNYLLVHLKAGANTSILKTIEAEWHSLNPNEPYEYSFLDEDFQKNYEAENRLSAIVGYFTIIAILISCLGLFGLATFSAEQRIKEIGVRKVLGASVTSIVGLLSKDFLKLVAISIIVASPIAWYVMNRWLQDFAYRIHISWAVFVITTVAALFIALLTISFQA